jgi:hypothetical protein
LSPKLKIYYPIKEGFIYRPVSIKRADYIPQKEDRGKVLIIYGPSPCPFSYVFLKRAEQAIANVAPSVPIRWVDRTKEPEEALKRGNVDGCIVNARFINSFVLNREDFENEVKEALKA